MIWACLGLLVFGIVMLGFYLLEKCRRYSLKGVFLKTVVSLSFLAIAMAASYEKAGHVLHPFVLGGLILGLLGDIWLDLKYVHPESDRLYTYAGFAVFGVGHLLFANGMLLEFFGNANGWLILLPVAAAVVFALGNLVLSKPMKLDFGSLKWVVTVYAFLLALTPGTALLCCFVTNWASITPIMLFAGGLSFVISDVVLSGTYFGQGKERPADFILNYLFYYGAQFTIAFSLLFL
ncbi:MAG: hypothetical protein IJU64_01110 [Bacilli bacterium]|nr:hypothetical protein [Bacilli bacterium]